MLAQISEVLAKLRREKNKAKGPWLAAHQIALYMVESASHIRDSANKIATSIDRLEAPTTMVNDLERCIRFTNTIDKYGTALSEIVAPGMIIQGKFKIKTADPSHHTVANRIEVTPNASIEIYTDPTEYYDPKPWL